MNKRTVKYWIQKRTRGWSDDETWNLDYEFMKWINTRFRKYKELAGKTIDLDYYKFEYHQKEYTQLELIDKILELTDRFLNTKMLDYDDKTNQTKNEVFDIFKLIFWKMGW